MEPLVKKHPNDIHTLDINFNSVQIKLRDIKFLDTYEEMLEYSKVASEWLKNVSYKDWHLSIGPLSPHLSSWPFAYELYASHYTPDSSYVYPSPRVDERTESFYTLAAFEKDIPYPTRYSTVTHIYTPTKFMSNIHVGCALEEERFYNLVRAFLLVAEQHEFDEFFKVGIKALAHPHREGYEPLLKKIEV